MNTIKSRLDLASKILLVLSPLIVTSLSAAVPPQQVTWTQSAPPDIAQSYAYKLYISEESGVKRTVPLANTLCGPSGNGSQCSTSLPIEANVAIITGNQSQITATNPTNKMESSLSIPFVGNQGCIFRNNLFKVTIQTTATSNKQNLNALLNEFKAAKFRHISTNQTRGNQYAVTEECVGYIVH